MPWAQKEAARLQQFPHRHMLIKMPEPSYYIYFLSIKRTIMNEILFKCDVAYEFEFQIKYKKQHVGTLCGMLKRQHWKSKIAQQLKIKYSSNST